MGSNPACVTMQAWNENMKRGRDTLKVKKYEANDKKYFSYDKKLHKIVSAYQLFTSRLNFQSFNIFQIYDECTFSSDAMIAHATFVIPDGVVNGGNVVDEWWPLSGAEGHDKEGMVHLVSHGNLTCRFIISFISSYCLLSEFKYCRYPKSFYGIF